ncbi:cysteine hydrolase family protein [Silvimonas amylolytica]|uniref:Hydrolase n=1 Tax=Silvimonas amylolytica TaxID=449663 RepID=A0ABQ2PSF8_9NEIS|nr:cysteine hydrolase family protein [Silvimonas amylolytica]GGP28170.1 hydrolase [Silvimonas amylolytica]
MSASQSALLIIDMQAGHVGGPERPHALTDLLANINILIGKARAAGAPVYAVRHTGPADSPIAAGSPLWQLSAALDIDPTRDRVFDKHRISCFNSTPLAQWLQQDGVSRLIIAGMKTQYCVDTACREAADRGYNAVLASDAHSCVDTPQLAASAIIAHHNATLSGPFVTLQSTADIAMHQKPGA